jgi:hypothetical protein
MEVFLAGATGAIGKWSLGLRGAFNGKVKSELGRRPQYKSWRQGFFDMKVGYRRR